jgi:hypothetical protein
MNRLRPVCALVAGLMSLLAAARSESLSPPPDATRSLSGQFSVSLEPDNNPYFRRVNAGTNTGLLRLEPALLAVSAERFKAALGREIGLAANTPWSGKIFLVLHPARSLDEPVNLVAQPFLHHWNYRLELPDLVTRHRCARAFSAVILLEIANRGVPAGGHSAALPEWLVAGLARQVTQAGETPAILSAPTKMENDLVLTRRNDQRRGIDPLAAARRVLQNSPALTFEQLSWPADAQVNGDDGGVFPASAQLFVSELLALKDGPAKVRALLAQLPAYENWQSAFLAAFRENFQRPLDVEKWWSLRVVAFAARAPGPLWTTAVSRDKLEAALAVPVNLRYSPNALPSYAEISLQSVIQNFEPERQGQILQTRLRDLELIQFRLTPSLAGLADGYRKVLSDYLHARKKFYFLRQPGAAATVKQLNLLDARRREAEARLKVGALPPDLNLPAP